MGVRYIFGQDGAFRTEPVIVAKNITENGTYDPATEGADGYAPVVVNVEGGGGSSDFSTAEVTFVVQGDAPSLISFNTTFYLNENDLYEGSFFSALKEGDVFKGTCLLNTTMEESTSIGAVSGQYDSPLSMDIVSCTGNAELIEGEDYKYVALTGDCTITVTLS